MKNIAFLFFVSGVVCVTLGMLLGLQMAASQDHSLASAHAHLNLVGWASLALFGIYYHLTPRAAETRLAQVHYALAISGVAILVPGIALATRGGSEGLAILGSLLSFASMAVFLYTVLRHGLGSGFGSGHVLRRKRPRRTPARGTAAGV